MLTLTKHYPPYSRTFTAKWMKTDFTTMSQQYRDIRAKAGKPLDDCWICSHKFKDGEVIALACFDDRGNKVLCQSCAGQFKP